VEGVKRGGCEVILFSNPGVTWEGSISSGLVFFWGWEGMMCGQCKAGKKKRKMKGEIRSGASWQRSMKGCVISAIQGG